MKIRPFILAILTASTGCFFSTAPLKAQVTSNDSTFTPSLLKSGLSTPSGIAFRLATGDLVVTQTSANQVSLVDASSGSTKNFVAQQSANEVAVRASDGLVAVSTHPGGPIDFYSSTGAFQGSIAAGTPNACIGGLTFDTSGNLFVAAGPSGGIEGPPCSPFESWSIYEFAGPNPWQSESQQIIFGSLDQIEGLTFSAATPPGSPTGTGVLYAVSPTGGEVYQIFQCFSEGPCFNFSVFAGVDPGLSPSGIAVDPLLGNIYVSELNGQAVVRFPPPSSEDPITTFATGFSSSFGLTFDRDGNLYVNDTNAGNVWKFARAGFATPEQQIVQGQTMTFINANTPDQILKVFLPLSASLCDANGCAAFIRAHFVPVPQDVLNARLAPGSPGNAFFGGGPISLLSTCTTVPSASPDPTNPTNCLVTLQECFDINNNPFPICSMVHASPDVLQLTSSFNGNTPPGALFGIDFDAPTSSKTGANVTTQPLHSGGGDPSGGGGPHTFCSGTFFYSPPPGTPDFSLGPVSLSPIIVSNGSGSGTVPVNSLNGFSLVLPVMVAVVDVPVGVTATPSPASPASVPLGSSTTVNVTVSSSFDSATTIPAIKAVIANLLASGCITDSGIANALTSKLDAAQAAINAGRLQTAANILGAFNRDVQAQAGKHIGTSCTATFTMIVTGTASTGEVQTAAAPVSVTGVNAANILVADASAIITSLAGVNTPDPITGSVLNNGVGVSGATVSLVNGATQVSTATTDGNGFYYFPNTSSLQNGVTYTVTVTLPFQTFTTSTPASQTFTWAGKGLALSPFNLN